MADAAIKWDDTAFRKALAELGNKPHMIPAVLYDAAGKIMAESYKQVPWDIGTLRASGFVQKPVSDGGGVSVTMGYGGLAKAYALIQHEVKFNHPKGGKDHYLYDPAMEAAGWLGEWLAARLRSRFGK
jgi:hypothetical protein